MMSSPDAATRTGHLSALVGELAAVFNAAEGDPAAVQVFLERLTACAAAWLMELLEEQPDR